MSIQDEMFKDIENEINDMVASGAGKLVVDYEKAKEVAKMLTELSVEPNDAETLTNQYIANIKNICQ